MPTYIDKTVGLVSPNLYAAAKQANLSLTETTQIEQMSYTIRKHRELKKLTPDIARKQYDGLDPMIQDQLKSLFKNEDYLIAPPDAGDRVVGAIKGTLKFAASPLIGLFKLGGQYNRLINEPYKIYRQVSQGADLFSTKTWTDAWDGKNQYDNAALKEVTDYFGKYDVFVAKGLSEGKTPGEVAESYGQINDEILASIQKAFNNPEEFQKVMDGVKYAQVSPGRDVARMLDRKGFSGSISQSTRKISGVLDFVYQLAVDPLTWATGGLNKGVTKGERLANSIKESINSGVPAERAIENAFKDPKLSSLWDNGIGPALKEVKISKTAGEKSKALDAIAKNFPGWNDPMAIETLVRGGAFDASSAERFFSDAANLNLLLAGRVDGTTFMRNGVVIARSNRMLSDAITRRLDGVFNNMSRTAAEVDRDLEPITKALLNNESSLQRLKNPDADLSVVIKANAEITRWKKVGRLAARSPMGQEVRIGRDAIKTIANFTSRARLILPKDLAQALSVRFLESTADQQIVILRNLDAATMYSMGLGGHAKGEELISKILQDKYGSVAGFATKKDLSTNKSHAKYATPNLVKETGTDYKVVSESPIHPYQSTWAVGSLPYEQIGSAIWDIKSKKNIIGAVGGAVLGDHSKKIVNSWSILTLFPRLGVRSSIDEATMFLLTAPGKDVLNYIRGRGTKYGNFSRSFTGSKSSTGPIRDAIQKTLKFKDRNSTTSVVGKRPRYTHEEALSIIDRETIINAKALELGVDPAQLSSLTKRQAIGEHLKDMYGPYLKNDEELDLLLEAFVHSPDALNSMADSIIAASSISGRYGHEVMEGLITKSALDKAYESMETIFGKTTRTFETGKLSERQVALAHYEKWFKMFAGNNVMLPNKRFFSPSEIFFRNRGLKPGEIAPSGKETFEQAINDGLEKIGFEFNELTSSWRVIDQKAIDAFKESTAFTTGAVQQGLDDLTIVKGQLFRIFADMFETFNGSSAAYNDKLVKLVANSYGELVRMAEKSGRDVYWNDAVARISLDEFHDATEGFRIKGEINSQLDFGNFDAESVFQRFGNGAMSMMDKQVTGIFRQPAVMITYVRLRKEYAGIQKEFVRQQVAKELGPWKGKPTKKVLDETTAHWEEIGKKRYTEIAVREAADIILKFADNPNVRSNFAFSLRTVGRYYRATEDFYRRIYRMKDVSFRTLHRLRLIHVGIDASGMIHNDQDGEPYIVMPMDNILFKATNGTLGILQGKGLSGYTEPSFNEFTLKLRMANPSFSQDAGLPTLSGPVAGLSVIGIKNLLGTVPGRIPFIGGAIQPYAKQLGESIDTFALGNIGDNIGIVKAIVPASLQRIWSALSFDEQNRQLVTAAQQAVAYHAAHGDMLNPNSTDQEKAAYLANMRISAHNVLFMRHMLGLFSPIAPTIMETKGVPDYIKDTGITGLRSEFFDILGSVYKLNSEDVQEPYEVALATFIGKNPGKLIYTVSREDKQTKVWIKNTDQLKNWGIKNEKFIKEYNEVGYIFAPQSGKFNAATYNWIQAAGLVKSKSLEKYYNDLLVAEDKQKYYDIARQEKEILSTMADPQLRQNVINNATDQRNALKANNPLLNSALIGQGNSIGQETTMMNSIEQAIADPNSPIDRNTRLSMQLAINIVRDFMAFTSQSWLKDVSNGTDIKAQRRLQVEADLQELGLSNPYVAEATRAIFKSIVSNLSRDSYRSYK